MIRIPKQNCNQESNTHRRGATTVEFALTLPIAFLLFFGAIEMSRLNAVRNTADNAAYEGARGAILPGATKSHVDKEAESILNAGSISNATITMVPAKIDSSTERVTVTVAVKMNQNSWVAPVYSKNLVIKRSCTLSREQALGTGTAVASPDPRPTPKPDPKKDPKEGSEEKGERQERKRQGRLEHFQGWFSVYPQCVK